MLEQGNGEAVLTITAADITDGIYTGQADVSDFDGHIVIAANLGRVRFTGSIRAKLSITAEAGSGIEAGEGIEAGLGIEAGEGIEAGWGIKAGEGIEAGLGIEAGWDIEAGWGIKAGLAIRAKFLAVKLRIFAGLCMWRLPSDDEMQIRAEIREGTVAHGVAVAPEAA